MSPYTKEIVREKQKFEGYLLQKELNLTEAREIVFEVIIRTHGHFTAEEIVKFCKTHKKEVSRATIYRSLRELLEAGVIRETAFGDKHHHYEHTYDEKLHHHARCIRCSCFIELPDLNEDSQYKPLLEKEGFQILGHELHFYGLCQKCIGVK